MYIFVQTFIMGSRPQRKREYVRYSMNPDNYKIALGGILHFEVECDDSSTPDLGLPGIEGMDSKCWMDMAVKMDNIVAIKPTGSLESEPTHGKASLVLDCGPWETISTNIPYDYMVGIWEDFMAGPIKTIYRGQ